MRFFWLAISLIIPSISAQFIANETNQNIQLTYLSVTVIAIVISIGITISEFIKTRRAENHREIIQIKNERDEDIKKWRKEFIEDTLRIYEVQKESFTKAMELN